jgi:hypothetical protein
VCTHTHTHTHAHAHAHTHTRTHTHTHTHLILELNFKILNKGHRLGSGASEVLSVLFIVSQPHKWNSRGVISSVHFSPLLSAQWNNHLIFSRYSLWMAAEARKYLLFLAVVWAVFGNDLVDFLLKFSVVGLSFQLEETYSEGLNLYCEQIIKRGKMA